jgi:hypothetical protein
MKGSADSLLVIGIFRGINKVGYQALLYYVMNINDKSNVGRNGNNFWLEQDSSNIIYSALKILAID